MGRAKKKWSTRNALKRTHCSSFSIKNFPLLEMYARVSRTACAALLRLCGGSIKFLKGVNSGYLPRNCSPYIGNFSRSVCQRPLRVYSSGASASSNCAFSTKSIPSSAPKLANSRSILTCSLTLQLQQRHTYKNQPYQAVSTPYSSGVKIFFIE